MSCRTRKALEIYSVFSSTALFAMFSFQHSTAACLCWPSLPSSFPPHLQAIRAQEIQYYLKYLTKGLNYSLGSRRELPHGYSSRTGWQALRDSLFAASHLPQARESSPPSSPSQRFFAIFLLTGSRPSIASIHSLRSSSESACMVITPGLRRERQHRE